MELHDRLQICLLALESRYPGSMVEVNRTVLDTQCPGCRSTLEVIEALQQTTPQILQAMAHLVIDRQKSEIFLVEYSKEVPAFWLHCRGRIPPHAKETDARWKPPSEAVP